jgi:hypothetical protein
MNNLSQRVTQRIQIGTYLEKGSIIGRIASFGVDNLTVIVVDESTGFEKIVSIDEILNGDYRYAATRQQLFASLECYDSPPRLGLPKALWDKATKIVAVVEGFEA